MVLPPLPESSPSALYTLVNAFNASLGSYGGIASYDDIDLRPSDWVGLEIYTGEVYTENAALTECKREKLNSLPSGLLPEGVYPS